MNNGIRIGGSGIGHRGTAGRRLLAAVWLAAVGCVLLAGCGGSTLEKIPVSGRVTYGGGDWPKPGIIDFTPVKAAEGKTLHPGSGRFDTDGSFTVESAGSPGLVAGEYSVKVQCWETPPAMDNPAAAKSYVPQKYQNPRTSELKLVIEAGQSSAEFTADIPKQ